MKLPDKAMVVFGVFIIIAGLLGIIVGYYGR